MQRSEEFSDNLSLVVRILPGSHCNSEDYSGRSSGSSQSAALGVLTFDDTESQEVPTVTAPASPEATHDFQGLTLTSVCTCVCVSPASGG